MTTLKVNVIRKPTIKVKVLPNFPSSVTVSSPILLSRVGGNYTFSFDQTASNASVTIDAGNIISGTLPIARMPALTGDITTPLGSVATTLATVNANVGTFGSATQSIQATFNAKGLLTAAANVTITPAIGSVTGLGTGVATWLATPTSANLRAAVTDETGTGALVFAGGAIGAATATSINGISITASSGTLTLNTNTLAVAGAGVSLTLGGVTGKTLNFNNTLTLAGTDGTTQTFPTTSATIARTDAAQTFTGTQTYSGALVVNNTIAGGAFTGTSTSANALAVGANGATNPAFNVDASTGSQVAGLSVKGAVTGGTVDIAAIDSGANTSLRILSKGTGSITASAPSGSATVFNIGQAGLSGASFTVAGSSSGALTVAPPAAASGTLNLVPGTLTGSTASAIWYDNIPQNSQSAAYGLVLADAQKHIYHPVTDNNARTFTIPANASVAYPIGTAITFVNEINTVTIAITTDTLILAGAGTAGSRTLAAAGVATAIKVTSTRWIISGTGLT